MPPSSISLRSAAEQSPPDVRGRIEPRIFTPPFRDLSLPDSSWGYDLADFAEAIGWPLDPWQVWLAVHLGELLADGSPRFRKAIIVIARQNGKTIFARILVLYWMFVDRVGEINSTSTDRGAAKRSWLKIVEMAEQNDVLREALPKRHIHLQIGEEHFWNDYGSTFRFAAPNRRAARGDTLHRALLDELREHRNRDTWDAIVPTMNTVHDGLLVCVSNEGGPESIVLHEEMDNAAEYIETGKGDRRVFLAAWSAPQGSRPTDLEALAYANPGLGYRIPPDALLGQAIAAERAGGETLARFRIEIMCQRVDSLAPAIDAVCWADSARGAPLDLAEHRATLALCLDVSLDGSHATLAAAALVDGVVHLEIVRKWEGFDCTSHLRRELPDLVTRVRPRALGWFPSGPAAAVATGLAARRGVWPPRRVVVEELRSEVPAVCMGFAEAVQAGQIRHPDDPMLNGHIKQAERLRRGDQWVFIRRGAFPIDATYAVAGAVHLARTLPAAPEPLTIA